MKVRLGFTYGRLMDNVVATIGKCSGCGSAGRLQDLACGACRDQFGPRCGHIMARIRKEPSLMVKCYDGIKHIPGAEARFREMFGYVPK